ncbi:hypothetical protein ACJX0J_031840, partial [Zea mays]
MLISYDLVSSTIDEACDIRYDDQLSLSRTHKDPFMGVSLVFRGKHQKGKVLDTSKVSDIYDMI